MRGLSGSSRSPQTTKTRLSVSRLGWRQVIQVNRPGIRGQRRPKTDTAPCRVGGLFGVVVGGDPPEVAVFESVAVAFEGDDFGVVDEAVDHGVGDDGLAADLTPAPEGFVAGDDEVGPFVSAADPLEGQVGGFGFLEAVADLVDDE